jgi:hypothetical protein
MPKRAEHDFAINAFRIVEQAIGEHMDGAPLEDPNAGKNPVAVERGRLGGVKGGPSRAAKLPSFQRKAIATNAANSRWGKPVKAKD